MFPLLFEPLIKGFQKEEQSLKISWGSKVGLADSSALPYSLSVSCFFIPSLSCFVKKGGGNLKTIRKFS